MENRNNNPYGYGYGHDGYYGSPSSSPTTFDHLFGPKDSSSSSTLFGSIFSPTPTVFGRDSKHDESVVGKKQENESGKYKPTSASPPEKGSKSRSGKARETSNTDKSSSVFVYEAETAVAEPCYLSSSIHYGGQENYSPRSSAQSRHPMKKDDDPSGSTSPDGASRGNWWQGSLYY